jgi:YfiH family protein
MSLLSLRFRLLESHVSHAIFTRHGGASAPPFDSLNVSYSMGDDPALVAENRRRCAEALALSPRSTTTAGLVHGAAIAHIIGPSSSLLPDGGGVIHGVDGLITATPGQALLVTAADCLQVLFLDPGAPAIGLAHAGWRGLVAGVLGATVAGMGDRFGSRPADLLAGIGPGLGPCCARFSDPAHELPAWFAPHIRPDHHVDLWAAARDQLLAAGVGPDHIEHHAICTVCRRDRFFSHRGDGGRTGRFAAIIAMPGTAGP